MSRLPNTSKPVFEDLLIYSAGRRNRKSYVLIMAIYVLISIFLVFMVLPGLVGANIDNPDNITRMLNHPIALAVALPLFLLQFAPMTQRCRDMNRSGWWVLLNFVPLLSLIFHVVLLFVPGTNGKNYYGPDPRTGGI